MSIHICVWSFVLSLSLRIVCVVFPSLPVVYGVFRWVADFNKWAAGFGLDTSYLRPFFIPCFNLLLSGPWAPFPSPDPPTHNTNDTTTTTSQTPLFLMITPQPPFHLSIPKLNH